jgi:hypothetical protein
MSIISRISAATAGIAATAAAFALFALGTTTPAEGPSPASTTVVADNPWGQPPTTTPSPNSADSDDNPWG